VAAHNKSDCWVCGELHHPVKWTCSEMWCLSLPLKLTQCSGDLSTKTEPSFGKITYSGKASTVVRKHVKLSVDICTLNAPFVLKVTIKLAPYGLKISLAYGRLPQKKLCKYHASWRSRIDCDTKGLRETGSTLPTSGRGRLCGNNCGYICHTTHPAN
jgi:hypothetical protein